MNKAIFTGPFCYKDIFQIEQSRSDHPCFTLFWNENNKHYFAIYVYDPRDCSKQLYRLTVYSSEIFIDDRVDNKQIHGYKVNSDGFLGEKLIHDRIYV